MQIAVSDAKALLLDLVRRAEAGEEIVLTRHGAPVARITTVTSTAAERRAAIDEARKAAAVALPGPPAERAADFLFDENGMPG